MDDLFVLCHSGNQGDVLNFIRLNSLKFELGLSMITFLIVFFFLEDQPYELNYIPPARWERQSKEPGNEIAYLLRMRFY